MTVLVAYNDSPQGETAFRAAVAEAVHRSTALAVLVLTPQDANIRDGLLAETSGELARLLGRPTTPLVDGLHAAVAQG